GFGVSAGAAVLASVVVGVVPDLDPDESIATAPKPTSSAAAAAPIVAGEMRRRGRWSGSSGRLGTGAASSAGVGVAARRGGAAVARTGGGGGAGGAETGLGGARTATSGGGGDEDRGPPRDCARSRAASTPGAWYDTPSISSRVSMATASS